MKHFYKLLFIIFFLCQISQAQDLASGVDIKIGNYYPVVDNRGEWLAFSYDSTYILSFKYKRKSLIVQKLSMDGGGELLKKENENFPKSFRINGVLFRNDRVFLFYSEEKKLAQTMDFYVSEMDVNTLAVNEGRNVLSIHSSFEETAGRRKLLIEPSLDASKILIFYKENSLNNSKAMFRYYVLDSDFNLLTEQESLVLQEKEKLDYISISISNKGDVYGITSSKLGYNFVKINDDGVNFQPITFKNSIDIGELRITENENGTYQLIAYYGEYVQRKVSALDKVREICAQGIYKAILKNNGGLIKEYIIPFPGPMIYKSLSKGDSIYLKEKEYELGLRSLKLHDVNEMKDSSIVVVGEVSYVSHEYDLGAYRNIDHNMDIVVAKVSKDGRLLWYDNIKKHQLYSGFVYQYSDLTKTHYFLFPDNKANADITEYEVPKIHRAGAGGFLTTCTYNEDTMKGDRYLLMDLRDCMGLDMKQFYIHNTLSDRNLNFYNEVYIGGKRDIILKITLDPNLIN